MKKIIFATLIFVLTLSSLAQPVITTCEWDNASLRVKPSTQDSIKLRVPLGAPITVLATANDQFFKILYKSDTGYMMKECIIKVFTDKNGVQTNNSKLFEKVPDEFPKKQVTRYYTANTINGARGLYGNEDEKSTFQSGEYDAITLVWHCANGKYRSITYIFKGEYQKASEFVSDCIR